MTLFGRVNAKWRHVAAARQSSFANFQISTLLARRSDGVECAARPAVVNDALKFRRQAEYLPQPIECDLFKLRCRWARLPEHVVDVESGTEQFAQNARRTARRSEVSKEARMVPMRHAG